MYWFGHGINAGGYILMMIGMVAFWGVLIYAAATFFRRTGRTELAAAAAVSPFRSPQQQLAARFANGEIDEDSFTDQLDTLHRNARR